MPVTRRTFWNLGLFAVLLTTAALALRERQLGERETGGDPGGSAPVPRAGDARSKPPPSLDLLQIISVPRDVVNGEWRLEGEGLVTGDAPFSRLALPAPPREYDLRLLVERRSGEDSLNLGLAADGKQFVAVIDGWTQGELTGIDLIGDKPFFGNATTYGGRLLPKGKSVEVLCSVRKNHVTLRVDDKPVFHWPADYASVRLYREWAMPDPSCLFVGTYATRFLIRKLVLVDRTSG